MRRMTVSTAVCSALALTFFASGCTKKESAPATTQQSAAPAATTSAPLVQYGFESGNDGWTGTGKGVTLENAPAEKHGGNAAVKVSGTAGTARWNFAASPKLPLEPGKRYKLTGWMLVEKWNNTRFLPHLKVGMSHDGTWVSNALTSKYDLKKSGQWQELSVTFDVPQGANNGFVALEKGTKDAVTGSVVLDDISVEAAL